MKHLLFTFYFIFLTVLSFGQTCLPDGITFGQQGQIDSFPILYPGCTEILGDVLINSIGITSFQGLDSITRIHGQLKIEGTSVPNLEGFSSLFMVNKLDIRHHNSLSLPDIVGFENLEVIESDLTFWENDSLDDIVTGFGNLREIGGTLFFANNMGLLNISGFNELERIGGNFLIGEFVVMFQLDGLNSLQTIGGRFVLSGTQIVTVDGLSSLDTIGAIGLGYNWDMINLDWLDGLDYIGSGTLSLENNFMLNSCAIQAVCDHLLMTNLINQINNNIEGCNSVEEVLQACILSTGNQDVSSSFYVYPNPTIDKINVVINLPDNNDEYSWQLIDARGNAVQEFLYLEDDINLSIFPNGLYTLVLKERIRGKIFAARRVIKID